MDMDVCISMSICDLLVINLRQPVIGRYCSGVGQNQSAHGIGHGRIFLYTPILYLNIAVYNLFIIKDRGFHVPDLFSLLPIKDVSLGHISVSCLHQGVLHAVLNALYVNLVVLDLILKIRSNTKAQ